MSPNTAFDALQASRADWAFPANTRAAALMQAAANLAAAVQEPDAGGHQWSVLLMAECVQTLCREFGVEAN